MTETPSKYPRKLLPMMPRYEPESFDHTATKEFKTCPRKYFYRMVLGRTSPDGQWEAVCAWGKGIHKFMEILYQTGDAGKAMTAAEKVFRAPTHYKFMYQDKQRFVKTLVECTKYYENEKKQGNITVIATEQPFHIVFPDGHTVGGRFDQLIKWNGRVWIRDWKTTSKELKWFATQVDPNDQAIRYIWAASMLQNGEANGLPSKVIDGVLFVPIYNTKTIGPTIGGVQSQRTLTQVEAWVKDTMHVHKMMELCRETDTWPMHEVSCNYCNYRPVCTQASESGMEAMLRSGYVLSPWKHENVDQDHDD